MFLVVLWLMALIEIFGIAFTIIVNARSILALCLAAISISSWGEDCRCVRKAQVRKGEFLNASAAPIYC